MKFGKLVGFTAFVVSLYLLWLIRSVVLLAFTAIALATVLNRVVRQLVRWRLSRGLAIAATVIMVLSIISVIVAIVAPLFIDQISKWLDQMPLEMAQVSIWLDNLSGRLPGEFAEQIQQLDTFIRDIPRIARSVFSNFFLLFRGTLSLVVNILLVVAVTIMLMANPRAYRRAFVSLFPQFYRHRVQDILDHCESSLVGWGVGILFNMLAISLMSFLGLSIIDVPLPIGNALIAGVLTFIPNVGPIVSVIPPMVLGLLEAPWKAVAVVGLYILIQQVESNFLTPLVMKKQVALLPAIALVSQLICGALFGFLGLFLALPLVVVGQVLLQELVVKDIMDSWYEKPANSPNRRLTAV